MRLKTENYQFILDAKQLSHEYVRKATGLSEKTYSWILDNGSAECETLERIADVVGCPPGEIIRPDYEGYSENVIECNAALYSRQKKHFIFDSINTITALSFR